MENNPIREGFSTCNFSHLPQKIILIMCSVSSLLPVYQMNGKKQKGDLITESINKIEYTACRQMSKS